MRTARPERRRALYYYFRSKDYELNGKAVVAAGARGVEEILDAFVRGKEGQTSLAQGVHAAQVSTSITSPTEAANAYISPTATLEQPVRSAPGNEARRASMTALLAGRDLDSVDQSRDDMACAASYAFSCATSAAHSCSKDTDAPPLRNAHCARPYADELGEAPRMQGRVRRAALANVATAVSRPLSAE